MLSAIFGLPGDRTTYRLVATPRGYLPSLAIIDLGGDERAETVELAIAPASEPLEFALDESDLEFLGCAP